MKKIFVSALTVLNLLFASAQEGQMNVSFAPASGAVETTTEIESKPVETQPVVSTQNQSTQSETAAQPVSQSATTQSVSQPATQSYASAQSAGSTSSSSSSSDDYDSDFFASNNEAGAANDELRNSFGIRFGYTSSRVASYGVYSGVVSGFTFGAVDQIWFGETNVFAEIGLFFAQKGYSLDYFEPSKTKLNYLEFPALICHRIGRETLSITAKAGGYLSCGIKGTLNTYVSDSPAAIDLFKAEHEYDLYKEGAISRLDAGARFGLAIVVGKVMLGCRYDLGLYKIDKKDIIYGDNELMLGYKHLQNRSVQILMGINFN